MDNATEGCLLILCPACEFVVKRCMFVSHCETECLYYDNIRCINHSLGCNEILNRLSVKNHLNESCKFNIKDVCVCKDSVLIKQLTSFSLTKQQQQRYCREHCENCFNINCRDSEDIEGGVSGERGVEVRGGSEIRGDIEEVRGERGGRSEIEGHIGREVSGGRLCRVMECVQRCGQRLHGCKMKEHVEEVCQLSVVKCFNEWSGCSETMLRGERGRHCAVCVCSVLKCGVEWTADTSRSKLYRRCLEEEDNGEWRRRLRRMVERRRDTYVDRDFCYGLNLIDELQICVSLSENEGSLNHEAEIAEGVKEVVDNDGDLFYKDMCELRKRGGTRGIYNRSRCPMVDRDSFRLECCQIVPRIEYADHYKQHVDLSCQMDGWIEMCCPFSSSGCPFTLMRLSPHNARLVYHPRSNYYGVRYNVPANEGYGDGVCCDQSLLLRLPLEVLILVCSFLDGCSLQQLTKAHKRLSEAVKMLIGGYYITLDWYRTKQHTWRYNVVSFLPTSRDSKSAVRNLQFTNESVGVMITHMSQCAFKGPLSLAPKTPPFCLHLLPPNTDENSLPEFLRATCHGSSSL